MARVLMLSSWVAAGHVGLCAAAPALQALGHEVAQLPTTMLSNHLGWPHVAGRPVPPDEIAAMADALDANGFLHGHDAFLVGYLPGAAHVGVAAALIDRLRAAPRPPRIVVDPVLGDHPQGFYVPEETAEALARELVPRADVLTPNRFELGVLTGRQVETLEEAHAAGQALRERSGGTVCVTSPPVSATELGAIVLDGQGPAQLYRARAREGVPHGVGDVFGAFVSAGLDVGTALGYLQTLIDASLGAPHLLIAETAGDWSRAAPLPRHPMPERAEG